MRIDFLTSPIISADREHSTPLLQDWLGDDAAKRHRREIHFPSGRFGEAIEQAYAVLFLASDESSFINGQDFIVDGGMTKVDISILSIVAHAYSVSRHTLLLMGRPHRHLPISPIDSADRYQYRHEHFTRA